MSVVTQPVGVRPSPVSVERAARECLDLLASGGCTPSEFLQAIRERFGSEPDGHWEALSQLDQYYRLGKIRPDVFQIIKTMLASSALGNKEPIPVLSIAREKTKEAPKLADPVTEVGPGTRLRGRYRIASVLGRGGMGTVFEAVDEYRLETPPPGQHIAVKVLNSAVAERGELLNALRMEFQHLQLLSHPNIVRVFDFDRDASVAFFTMELLHGILLAQVLAERLLPLEHPRALAVIHDVGSALVHAHSRGVIHGDVNPRNIFVTFRGDVRVLDFGTSRKLARQKSPADPDAARAYATPDFASCQVLSGEPADTRDDIFSLACVAYLLFSGHRPFPQKTALEARAAGAIAPKLPQLNAGQWQALRDGLQWEREQRPADMASWLMRLEMRDADSAPPGTTQKTSGMVTIILAVLAVLLGLGYWIFDGFDLLAGVGKDSQAPAVTAAFSARPSTESSAAASAAPAAPLPLTPQSSPAPAPRATSTMVPITSTPPPSLAVPSAAPTGPSRIELAADAVDVASGDSAVQIAVRRKGNLHGEVGFIWWTESGTAKPGVDFMPVMPQPMHIADGSATTPLVITLTGAVHPQPKSFYVVIDQPEGNATLGTRTVTMITLTPAS
jgi:serine/threonine protein kinase